MNITYLKLLHKLGSIPAERLNDTVSIYDESEDEYYPVEDTFITEESDVLDKGHLVLKIKKA
jgi:hypothetical protein